MKIAWLECATGISGDMTLAALIDAGVSREAIRSAIASLNLPDVQLRIETVIKNGFRAIQVLVDHPEQHAHRHFTEIVRILDNAAALTDRQRELAKRLFLAVAESEARVHGSTVEKVHFHEVGAVDSIVDIVGAAVGFDLLNVDRVVCNFVPTGRGSVHIDHGICPIPAPGTAEILKGIPLADVPIDAELTTPTGAAIVKTLADAFGPMPAMTVDEVGYGAGSMTFPQRANILRLFVGKAAADADMEFVTLLETNLDDVSGEVIGHVRQRLARAGALDVWVTPVQMKKDRPGAVVSVLCSPESIDSLETILFDETGTLGIRRLSIQRRVQFRDKVTVTTPWGDVSGKRSWRTGTSPSFAPEFDDCAAVARNHGVPLRDVYRAAESAFLQIAGSGTLPVEPPGGTSVPDGHHDHSHDHDHDHDHDHSHDHDHDHSHDHDHDGHTHDHE
ncbi:MAG: nickel pincer cofactor biosynthesis protein LarC [Planctomycetaceae bacterium]